MRIFGDSGEEPGLEASKVEASASTGIKVSLVERTRGGSLRLPERAPRVSESFTPRLKELREEQEI